MNAKDTAERIRNLRKARGHEPIAVCRHVWH